MSQILTLDLNDRVFTAIQKQAQSIGIPPELLAANLLEQKFAAFTGLLNNTEQQAKRAKFEQHFGEIDLSLDTDLDNALSTDKHFEQEGFNRLLRSKG